MADVATNLIDPGLETRQRLKAIQMFPGFQQRFLDHIVNRVGGNTPQRRQAAQPQPGCCEDTICIGQKRRPQALAALQKYWFGQFGFGSHTVSH